MLCDFSMLVFCVETRLPIAMVQHKAPTFWAGIQALHSLVLPATPFWHSASALSQLLHYPAMRPQLSLPAAFI